ncbi:MAG TPA: 1-acyl-sn-glycerol-3-phosphate acyltransferase, partial [Sphingomicrobium sp.]|nr:1-acyl-sn-glycerol-3-phosphate acyltransferase [Sphingomicrobium sp.]
QHIYPQELEETVGSIPGLRRGGCAAFGTKDSRTGTEKLVLLAETGEQDPEQLDRLKQSIAEVVHELLGAPPEEIILAPPGTVPKTSSGKIRRGFARQLYERRSLSNRPAAVRWQMLALAIEGIGAQARRLGRSTLAILYGCYWWLVIGAISLVTWPLILLLPLRSWRWATLKRLARLAFAVLRVPLQYKEESAIPATAILVANHSSYLDGLVLAAVLPRPLWFVAKRELASQLIAGPFLRALGTIFVERELEGALKSERALLKLDIAGRRMVIFPEGTFTRAPRLQPFHLGAFALASAQSVPVVPVAIRGARSVLGNLRQLPRRRTIEIEAGYPILAGGRDFQAVLRLRAAAHEFIASRVYECGSEFASEGP